MTFYKGCAAADIFYVFLSDVDIDHHQPSFVCTAQHRLAVVVVVVVVVRVL